MNSTAPYFYGPNDIDKIKDSISDINVDITLIKETIGDPSNFPEDIDTISDAVMSNYNNINDIQDYLSDFSADATFAITGNNILVKKVECGNMVINRIYSSVTLSPGGSSPANAYRTINELKNTESFVLSFEPTSNANYLPVWNNNRYINTTGQLTINYDPSAISTETTFYFNIIVLSIIPTT